MFSLEALIFFISSLLIFILIYYQIPYSILQQITAFLLVALLILLIKNSSSRFQLVQKLMTRLTLLFLSSLFVQLLVISTGGFLSPFLILLHLFTLGTSFLLNIQFSMSFLLFSVSALTANLLLNKQMLILFENDPGPTILYFTSFIVVIPLAQFLMSSYHLKDKLSKVLREYAQIGEKREVSILTGLRELVIITDTSLRIISTNEAVEKATGLSQGEIVNHPFLEVIPLQEKSGTLVQVATFALEQIITNRVIRIINDLYFQVKGVAQRQEVILQIRPITNSQGVTRQIVFIITDTQIGGLEKHSDLERAQKQHQLLISELRQALLRAHLGELAFKLELTSKTEEDLLLAMEIEDHPIVGITYPHDIAYIGKQVLNSRREFAQTMGVLLQFMLTTEDKSEEAMISLLESNPPKEIVPFSKFTVLTDKRWVEIVLQKLLDMAILLASGMKNSTVSLSPNIIEESKVNISIYFPYIPLFEKEKDKLFQKYYGGLGIKTNLQLGSGLEGFIAKTITDQLNIPLDVSVQKNPPPPSLILSLQLTKLPPSAKS